MSSSENIQIVETSIETAERHLSDPNVIRNLGSMGLRLSGLVERLYIPNIRDGMIQMGDEGGVPIVALHGDEKIQVDPDLIGLSDKQREHLLSMGMPLNEIDQHDQGIRTRYEGRWATEIASFALGSVTGTHSRRSIPGIGDGAVYTLKGRPLVILNADKRQEKRTILPHELVHVDQDERNPIRSTDELVSVPLEVQAYRAEAAIQAGLSLTKGIVPPETKARKVARAYQEFKQNNDLSTPAARYALEAQLRKEGIGITDPRKPLHKAA